MCGGREHASGAPVGEQDELTEICVFREGVRLLLSGTKALESDALLRMRDRVAVLTCNGWISDAAINAVRYAAGYRHFRLSLNKRKGFANDGKQTDERFKEALDFIEANLDACNSVVVHCTQGQHRSVAMVCAALVYMGRCATMHDAHELVQVLCLVCRKEKGCVGVSVRPTKVGRPGAASRTGSGGVCSMTWSGCWQI